MCTGVPVVSGRAGTSQCSALYSRLRGPGKLSVALTGLAYIPEKLQSPPFCPTF